jgi:hypothetical protein
MSPEWSDMSIFELLFPWTSTVKIQQSCWCSTKPTSVSSHRNVTRSLHNIAGKWLSLLFRKKQPSDDLYKCIIRIISMLFESVDPCRKEVKTEDVFLVYNHFNREVHVCGKISNKLWHINVIKISNLILILISSTPVAHKKSVGFQWRH